MNEKELLEYFQKVVAMQTDALLLASYALQELQTLKDLKPHGLTTQIRHTSGGVYTIPQVIQAARDAALRTGI